MMCCDLAEVLCSIAFSVFSNAVILEDTALDKVC
jgi:hypothetical protein